MPISNPKEEIDARVLRLIGLEDVFDLDYETYLTLLKEAMVKSRMTKKTIPTEEVMLLTEEYKRVKSKKDEGRFEVKKKKITAGSFSVGGIKAQIAGTATKVLPGTAIGASPISRSLEDSISTITSAVISIAETLRQQRKVSDDASAYDKRKAEQEKRGLVESKLEKRFEGLKKAAEKIIAPVKSLLDKILQFFTTIILGRIVYKLVEWLGDPNNASKVKSIIRFVKDWWPALLGSYILFGTSFGKLIRGTIGLVGRFIFQIGKVAIPQLLKFIKSPVGIGLGLFTAGATIPAMLPGTVNQQESQTSKAPGSNEDKLKSLQQQKANLNFFEKLQGKGSEIDEQISYLRTGKTKSYGFSGGGLLSGYVSGEKGVDKIPAMLSDGEFVMSRGAVSKYGVDTLEAMNAAGGGTNKPKIVSGVPYAAGGGYIGGLGELRKKYDTKHGEGAYDKESARRRALANSTTIQYNLPPLKTGNQEYLKQLKERAKPVSNSGASISANQIAKKVSSSAQGLFKSISSSTGVGSGKLTADQQEAIDRDSIERSKIIQQYQQKKDESKKARSEYMKILTNQNHPLYEQAAFGDLSFSKFKQQYKAPASAASTGYTPYVSRFAGARDAAFAKAKTMGGFTGIRSQDFYRANAAAREKQLSGLTSQQRLNVLSLQGKGPKTGPGRRFLAEQNAGSREFEGRGGMLGGIGRGLTRIFGSAKDRANVESSDRSSSARVKQAGAASIGRYYSSSDGKYYKDYNAALRAKKLRLAEQQKKPGVVKPPPKPKPKYTPAGGGMGGGRGSKAPTSNVTTPRFSASTKGSKTKAQTIGISR